MVPGRYGQKYTPGYTKQFTLRDWSKQLQFIEDDSGESQLQASDYPNWP